MPEQTDLAVWDESKHPRDLDGKFRRRLAAKAVIALFNGIDLNQPISWTPSKTEKTPPVHVREAIRERLRRHPVSAKNVLDMYEQQSTEQERRLGADWYPSAARITESLAAEHGVSRSVVAGLIANYSPQKPWGQNLIEANEALRLRRAIGGKGNKDNPLMGGGVMATDSQVARGSEAMGSHFGIPVHPEDVFAPKYGKKGTAGGKSAGQALKIRNFFKLVYRGGDDESVVVDRHAYGIARGIPLTEAEYSGATPSSERLYEEAADAYRRAAKVLSAKHGRRITPSEVQAATWLTRQRLNRASKARETLGQQDWENLQTYVDRFLPHMQETFFGGGAKTGYTLSLAFEMLDGDLDLAVWNEALHPRDSRGRFASKVGLAKSLLAMILPSDPRYMEVNKHKNDLVDAPVGSVVDVQDGPTFYADGYGWRDVTGAGSIPVSGLAEQMLGGKGKIEPPEGRLPPAVRERFMRPDVQQLLPEGWLVSDPVEAWGRPAATSVEGTHQRLAMATLSSGDMPLILKHEDGHVIQMARKFPTLPYPADDAARVAWSVNESLRRASQPGSLIGPGKDPITFSVPREWDRLQLDGVIAYVELNETRNVVISPDVVPVAEPSLVRNAMLLQAAGHFPEAAFAHGREGLRAYALTHELGHINDARGHHIRFDTPDGKARDMLTPIEPDTHGFYKNRALDGDISGYAEGHPSEAYAEAFAAYFTHKTDPDEVGGISDDIHAYAERYGWDQE